ncbi:2-C-methyl-D-erythritol 4-phosphate cytidylyltransferase [Ornithinimicrobium sp. INDO-MA30-4]|uniref:2-C-methyl-D-erythritol 4-phosphate cytidylyltransferase n=1 Tax=Ornithinimicrobium sp. INDO-MA30-4 TaxID=2908651 RepID=UPI002883048D|nr:2-C-methyl-D-erythritol 4-phosphate cytidylyltransferase [Ornithinimicrobium sp. INDO-MA30-4]
MSVGVILVAAGQGTRLGAGKPKALVELAGVSLLVRAVHGITHVADVAYIVVVAPRGVWMNSRRCSGASSRPGPRSLWSQAATSGPLCAQWPGGNARRGGGGPRARCGARTHPASRV